MNARMCICICIVYCVSTQLICFKKGSKDSEPHACDFENRGKKRKKERKHQPLRALWLAAKKRKITKAFTKLVHQTLHVHIKIQDLHLKANQNVQVFFKAAKGPYQG
jgi:hypothetical protein